MTTPSDEPLTDEQLATMEESWLAIDEVDRPRSLEQAIADINALIQEVRRLRGWQDGYRHENARIAGEAIRRAEKAEKEHDAWKDRASKAEREEERLTGERNRYLMTLEEVASTIRIALNQQEEK